MTTATISATKRGSTFSTTTDTTVFTNPRFKVGTFTLPTTTTSSDTTTINLWENFGIRKLLAIDGWQHTTENSVIELESVDAVSTTAVDGNTLSIAVNGTSDATKRVYTVYGI